MAIMDILIKNTKDRTDYTQYSLGSLSPTGEGVLGGKVVIPPNTTRALEMVGVTSCIGKDKSVCEGGEGWGV